MIKRNKFNVSVWDSATEIFSEAEKAYATLGATFDFSVKNIENRIAKFGVSKQDWDAFQGDKLDFFKIENITQFGDQQILQNALNLVDDLKGISDMGGVTEKSRIIATKQKIGIFDFGLASNGLYRPSEYYCSKQEALIDDDFILHEKIGANKNVFYYMQDGKSYIVRHQQKGTFEVVTKAKEFGQQIVLNELQPDFFVPSPSFVIDPITQKKYSIKFATTTEKIYLTRKREGGKVRAVELFFLVGGNWQTDVENALVKNIPLIMAAQMLERAGIRVRINALNNSVTHSDNEFYCWIYKIKDFAETVDWNYINVMTSDLRVSRWASWKVKTALQRKVYPGKDVDLYRSRILSAQDTEFNEMFGMIKNKLIRDAQKGKYSTPITDKGLFIAGGMDENSRISSSQSEIIKEYYRIIDTVEMMLSGNKRKSARRIIARLQSVGKDKNSIKEYFRKIYEKAYFAIPAVAKNDEFGDLPEDQVKNEERRDQVEQILIEELA